MLIKECLKPETAAEELRSIPMLQFVETSCSLLQQMPWITVVEHKVRMNSWDVQMFNQLTVLLGSTMFGNNRCHERLVQSSFCSRVCLFQIICACIWQCRYIQDNFL